MGENKKYYWLKLKDSFFRDKEIKKLRKIAGGDTYTIIYLKMQLLSLKKEGRLKFDNLEDSFSDEIALELDEETENVKITLLYLQKCGLLEEINDNEYMLPQAISSIGTETQGAERMRKCRERKVMSQCDGQVLLCDTLVTNGDTERREKRKEKELDIKVKKNVPVKIKYAEFITMTEIEYNKLVTEHGIEKVNKMIEVLDNYKGSSNKKYASDYRTILSWVVKRVLEDYKTTGTKTSYKID